MKAAIALLLLFFLVGCTSEPKDIHYEFKIVNDTDSDYVIRKHYKGASSASRIDTLFAGSEEVFSVPRTGSYGEPFGESLIPSFFDTLNVKIMGTNKTIDVSKRSKWKESAEFDEDFLEKPGSVKGKVTYTIKMASLVN